MGVFSGAIVWGSSRWTVNFLFTCVRREVFGMVVFLAVTVVICFSNILTHLAALLVTCGMLSIVGNTDSPVLFLQVFGL